jgi:peroxiredoxin
LARDHAALADQGVAVLLIGPGGRQAATRYHARYQLPFPVLADEDGQVYARYGVGRWLFALVRQSAVVVVDPAGRIAAARVVDNPRHVLDPAALQDALRAAMSAADQPA